MNSTVTLVDGQGIWRCPPVDWNRITGDSDTTLWRHLWIWHFKLMLPDA